MTLYNNARHLGEATDSILAQTQGDFALLMLDDGSSDETEQIAREYARRDPRVRYWRHEQRRGMVPTWKEVVEIARREYPDAEYFAWVSDHDRWHPEWLARLEDVLDSHPDVVLAYPFSPRIDEHGVMGEKEPREFNTFGMTGVDERWSTFCREGVGSGDMVYGLMRLPVLMTAGVFRPVLCPDRLLIAELTLQGQIFQVRDPLWARRLSGVGSVARQDVTLFAGRTPWWLGWPPWFQHALVLFKEYLRSERPPVRVRTPQMLWMLVTYQLTYSWRHVKKAETVHRIDQWYEKALWVRKIIKRTYHRAVYWTLVEGRRQWGLSRRQVRKGIYETLVAMHAARGRTRRMWRSCVYEVLMWTHRLGLRRGGDGPRVP
jgi:glycosyltransferase involved in cell wall biosynthesis